MGALLFTITIVALLCFIKVPSSTASSSKATRRRSSLRQSDIMPMFNSIKRKKAKKRRYFRKFGSF